MDDKDSVKQNESGSEQRNEPNMEQHVESTTPAFSSVPSEPSQLNNESVVTDRIKHSKLGITSFIIALIGIILIIAASILTTVNLNNIINNDTFINEIQNLNESNSDEFQLFIEEEFANNEELQGAILGTITAFVFTAIAIILSFIGFLLGIISLMMKDRRKLFGVIGILLNILVVALSIGLFALAINIVSNAI